MTRQIPVLVHTCSGLLGLIVGVASLRHPIPIETRDGSGGWLSPG